jgi:hypothetical protein
MRTRRRQLGDAFSTVVRFEAVRTGVRNPRALARAVPLAARESAVPRPSKSSRGRGRARIECSPFSLLQVTRSAQHLQDPAQHPTASMLFTHAAILCSLLTLTSVLAQNPSATATADPSTESQGGFTQCAPANLTFDGGVPPYTIDSECSESL